MSAGTLIRLRFTINITGTSLSIKVTARLVPWLHDGNGEYTIGQITTSYVDTLFIRVKG